VTPPSARNSAFMWAWSQYCASSATSVSRTGPADWS
jgi:hypothetical protein